MKINSIIFTPWFCLALCILCIMYLAKKIEINIPVQECPQCEVVDIETEVYHTWYTEKLNCENRFQDALYERIEDCAPQCMYQWTNLKNK